MIERIAQTRKEPLQPNPKFSANGTLTPAAREAPTAITLEYILVINPELEEKFCFVKVGNSTFPQAIAIPKRMVPMYKAGIQGIERIKIPADRSIKAISKTPPIPNFFVNIGANIDITPKPIKGKEVRRPKRIFDKPVDALISSTKGPTLAKAGRKLMAISKMPANNKAVFCLVGVLFLVK